MVFDVCSLGLKDCHKSVSPVGYRERCVLNKEKRPDLGLSNLFLLVKTGFHGPVGFPFQQAGPHGAMQAALVRTVFIF